MKNITTIFDKSMKMSDLIDADYRLLLLLMRLNIPLGFGDKTVDKVCEENGFDADCFIFLVNFQSSQSIINIHEEFESLPLMPFLTYLNNSHTYFLEDRLPNIRRKLKLVFSEDEKEVCEVVLGFFDKYVDEVNDHMMYEDEVAFPYIKKLIGKEDTGDYNISMFEERHNDIDEKMNDLKRILMKYVSGLKNQVLITNILIELYMTQEELAAHTFIEDELVIPRIKNMEGKRL